MKLIIAGCRNFLNYKFVREKILEHFLIDDVSEVVSGGASGVDALGECFAKEFQIPLKVFKANWEEYGKKAGPIRNLQMAQYSDKAIVFWDKKSKGSKNMIETMKKLNKQVIVVEIFNINN